MVHYFHPNALKLRKQDTYELTEIGGTVRKLILKKVVKHILSIKKEIDLWQILYEIQLRIIFEKSRKIYTRDETI